MRVYTASSTLSAMPSSTAMQFAGSAVVPFVNLHGDSDFRRYVAGTPTVNFLAQFFGNIKIKLGGSYDICDTSADGSMVWVDDKLVIDNSGRHAEKQKCAKVQVRS